MKKTLKKMLCGVCSAAMLMGAVSFNVSAASGFSDVKDSDYFAKPVEWAVQNGVTAGVGENLFGPNQSCTRAQAMTFLWRAAGSPEPTTSANFSDVKSSDYFAKPVAWAVANNVTAGVGGGKFGPNQSCTRGQIMTMLWRADQIDAPVVPDPQPTDPTVPETTEPTVPETTAPTEPTPTEPSVHKHDWVHGAFERAFECVHGDFICYESQAEAAGYDIGTYWTLNHQYSDTCDASYDEKIIFVPAPDSLHPDCWYCAECDTYVTENPDK